MVELVPQIVELVRVHPFSTATIKADGTPVTALDLALSTLIEEASRTYFSKTVIYSEENFSEWRFPLMAIDPLDGTKEYIQNRPEWAISVAHLANENFDGEGWIFNPIKNEMFQATRPISFRKKEQYLGEVSRSEWERGMYSGISPSKYKLQAVGSIAYKLGRLSAAKSDFVVSLAPKNIWDIAAGTILCKTAGMKFWSEGKVVTKVQKLYLPPLIWCHEELYPQLSETFR